MLNFDTFIRRCAILTIVPFNLFYRTILSTKKNSVLHSKKKITFLIINPQGYGDTIVMTPTLRALKKNFKKSKTIAVVSPKGYEVLKNCPYIDQLLLYEGNIVGYWNLIKHIKKLSIDVCLDFQITITNFRRWIFPIFTVSKYTIYFKRGGFRGVLPDYEVTYPSKHMVDNYLGIVAPLISKANNRYPEIFITNKDRQWAKQVIKGTKTNKKRIVIHTHSENLNHRWQTQKWVELAQKLSNEYSLLFTSPSSELRYVEGITNNLKDSVKVITPSTFNKLAALIGCCDLLITVDTSTVHISSATKTPAIILYGPTITHFWGPLNKNQIALQKDTVCKGKCRVYNMNNIFASRERCSEYHDNCIRHIKPYEVFRYVNKLVSGTKNEFINHQ